MPFRMSGYVPFNSPIVAGKKFKKAFRNFLMISIDFLRYVNEESNDSTSRILAMA